MKLERKVAHINFCYDLIYYKSTHFWINLPDVTRQFDSPSLRAGFGAAVRIYDTSAWPTEPRDVPPLFEHRGHAVSSQPAAAVLVTAHVWHPERPRTLLSAASDGSVHLWDWIDGSQ